MRPFYELTSADVGRSFLRAFGRPWLVVNFMGRVLPGDVGKRVYLVTAHDGSGFLQVENNEQRDRRLSRA